MCKPSEQRRKLISRDQYYGKMFNQSAVGTFGLKVNMWVNVQRSDVKIYSKKQTNKKTNYY